MTTLKHQCWVFTIQNPSAGHYPKFDPETMLYLGWAPQVGHEKKTPHLQAYVQFNKVVTNTFVGTAMRIIKDGKKHENFWREGMRGNPESASQYYLKDPKETNTGPIVEYGKMDMSMETLFKQTASDIFREAVTACETGKIKTRREIRDKYLNLYSMPSKMAVLMECVTERMREEKKKMAKPVIPRDPLFRTVFLPWLEKEYHYRMVLWVWSKAGQTGKTECAKAAVAGWHGSAAYLGTSNEVKDMNEAIYAATEDGCDLIALNVPRRGYPPYESFEHIRDGQVRADKNTAKLRKFSAHIRIIVVANSPPNPEYITVDGCMTVVCLDEDMPGPSPWSISDGSVRWTNM